MIGCIPIDGEAAYEKPYMDAKKFQLEEKYATEIEQSGAKPVFYIQAQSSMNKAFMVLY